MNRLLSLQEFRVWDKSLDKPQQNYSKPKLAFASSFLMQSDANHPATSTTDDSMLSSHVHKHIFKKNNIYFCQ